VEKHWNCTGGNQQIPWSFQICESAIGAHLIRKSNGIKNIDSPFFIRSSNAI
jgi:hypothetical protein